MAITVVGGATWGGTAYQGDVSANITPSGGTPNGVLVVIVTEIGTDNVNGVTYGGDALTEVTGSPLLHTTPETGAVHAFFKGSGVKTGTQALAIDMNDTSNDYIARGWVLSAGGDMEVHDTSTQDSTSSEYISVAMTITKESFVAAGGYSGMSSPTMTAQANTTTDTTGDFGQDCGVIGHLTTNPTGSDSIGWSQTADDSAILGVAVCAVETSTPKSGSDSGTGADSVASLAAAIAGTDSGAGAEASAAKASTVTDAGTGADTASLAVLHDTRSDAGTGEETATKTVTAYGTDAGTGSDTATLAALSDTQTEAGAGEDTAALAAAFTGSESGAGADTATVTVPVTASDAGVGVEVGGGGGGTVVNDTFTGTSTLASHTPDTGGAYTQRDTQGSSLEVASGYVSGSGPGDWTWRAILYSNASTLGDGFAKLTMRNDLMYNNIGGPMVRYDTSGDSYYLLFSDQTRAFGGASLRLIRTTNSAQTLIASVDPNMGSNAVYLKLDVTGSSPTGLRARWWTGTEPGTWNIDTSDNTAANQMASGPVGLYGTHYWDEYGDGPYNLVADDFQVESTSGGLAGKVEVQVAGTDAGAGSDVVAAKTSTGADAGTGADASTGISIATDDAGVGADTASVNQGTEQVAASDSATATDTASLAAAFAANDAGVGEDTSSLVASLTGSDVGAGADAGAGVSAPIAGADSGSAVDSVAVLAVAHAGADTGAGTDAAALAVALTSTESGTATDTGVLANPVNASDSGTATDTATAPVVAHAGTESGASTDTAVLAAALAGTESGTGADGNAQVGVGVVEKTASDSGAATDTSTLVVALAGADAALADDSGSLSVALPLRSDAGVATDGPATILRLFQVNDGAVAVETASVTVWHIADDSAVGTEIAGLAAALVALDAGAAADTSHVSYLVPTVLLSGTASVQAASGSATLSRAGGSASTSPAKGGATRP